MVPHVLVRDTMRSAKTRAVLLAALMVVSVGAPALVGSAAAQEASLGVSVMQDNSGEATVTVTKTANNTTSPVEGANVTVSVLDENKTYDGSGENVTDANGTVTLPAPDETVNVSVTATDGNLTETANATLEAPTDDGNESAFGQRVASFVHDLQSGNNTSDASFGAQVASFVLQNNPGNAPAHAGPPAWLTNDSVNKTTGPPAHAGPPENASGGPPENKTTGQPEDAGPPNGTDNGGPPDHAGDDDEEEESSD